MTLQKRMNRTMSRLHNDLTPSMYKVSYKKPALSSSPFPFLLHAQLVLAKLALVRDISSIDVSLSSEM
jgi:hypothetical protein